MRVILSIVFLLTSFISFGQVYKLDFKSSNLGPLTDAELESAGGSMEWMKLNNNSTVVDDVDRGKVLVVKYPEGTVGPNTNGSQFLKTLPQTSTEYYLDYYVKFNNNFDYQIGGKLPGLTSGGSTWTGGSHPTEGQGWSARYMWLSNGELVVYLYYVEMSGEYGESIKTNKFLQKNKWYRLTQRIKLNTNRDSNGILQVWLDGVMVIDKRDIVFRYDGKGPIDSFYFSTFHGGSSDSWKPDYDSYASFDGMIVSTDIPDFSAGETYTSSGLWQFFNVSNYTNIFSVEYDVVANMDNMDGVMGLLDGSPTSYDDLSCIVRFNTTGKLDAYSYLDYYSDNNITYVAGDKFHVRMEVNTSTQTYDILVSKNGGDEIVLGSDYGFRGSTRSVFNSWAIKAESGTHTVSNMKFYSGSLSVVDNSLPNLRVYPTSISANSVTIESNSYLRDKELNISLLTIEGIVLEKKNIYLNSDKTTLTLNTIQSQDKGIYLLQIESGLYRKVVKLIKK